MRTFYTLDPHTFLTPYFNAGEVASPDTGLIVFDYFALRRLSNMREIIGAPIKVTSGTRTPEHNRDVGGVPNSAHLYGQAFDLRVPSGSLDAYLRAAVAVGFKHVVKYPDGHLHVA